MLINLRSMVRQLISDEGGGEVLDYALIGGLLVVAAIAVITAVGTKGAGRLDDTQQ